MDWQVRTRLGEIVVAAVKALKDRETSQRVRAELHKIIEAEGDLSYKAYLRNTIIGCSTVMLDSEKVGAVSVPDFRTSEDTATWLDILKKGFLAYAISEPLTSYRIRRKSASSNKLKAAADLWSVYRKHEKMPFFNAVVCFISYAYHALKKHLR